MAYSDMTENMQRLFQDIIASLGQIPEDQKIFIFGEPGEEDMECVFSVAQHITLEFIKYAFDSSDPEYPIRHFIGNDANDSERMLQSRIIHYVLKYKKDELSRRNNTLPPNHKFSNTDMTSIVQKLRRYRITEMNYFEHQNIHDLEIIKAIVEKRIGSAKKISNERFQKLFEQYDLFIEQLAERAHKSDQDMIFASLAFFTLEWHYPLELFYELAVFMETEGISNIDINKLILLCGNVAIDSQFGGSITTDSRLVKERQSMLIPLFGNQLKLEYKEYVEDVYKEIIVLGVLYNEVMTSMDGDLYKEWFRKNSSPKDWASFFRYYDIFACWKKKDWTRTRISNMRKLIDMTTLPKR